MLPPGTTRNPLFTDDYLERNGAAKFSTVVMTKNGFLTDEAWATIVPRLTKGLRHLVANAAAQHGIDRATADKLLIGLCFDGFKSHTNNYAELINMADQNILACVENRDSSQINQVSLLPKFVKPWLSVLVGYNLDASHRLSTNSWRGPVKNGQRTHWICYGAHTFIPSLTSGRS